MNTNMNSSRLSALVGASLLLGAPAALVAGQPGHTMGGQPPMQVAADDVRGEGRPARSAKATAQDAAITAKVKTKLLADPDVAGMKIDVDTYDKVVMLSGTAASEAQIAKAESLAAQVEGVASVTNHLKLAN